MAIKKPLLDVLFASDKRKSLLLLLEDGPAKMEAILKSLETTRQALLPQIRTLEDHHLVIGSGDVYELTTIGKRIVDEMTPLIGTIDVLDVDIDFWAERNLDFIPPELLNRIWELKPYKINEASMSDMNQPVKELVETIASSKIMYAVTNIFHPNFMDMFTLWAQSSVEIRMIFSKELFGKLKTEYLSNIQQLMENENFHFYLYDKPFHSLYFAVNDHLILLAMLRKEGWYDEKALVSYSVTARQWGKELFEHYMKDSTPITEL